VVIYASEAYSRTNIVAPKLKPKPVGLMPSHGRAWVFAKSRFYCLNPSSLQIMYGHEYSKACMLKDTSERVWKPCGQYVLCSVSFSSSEIAWRRRMDICMIVLYNWDKSEISKPQVLFPISTSYLDTRNISHVQPVTQCSDTGATTNSQYFHGFMLGFTLVGVRYAHK
jgi:hypothetical protein